MHEETAVINLMRPTGTIHGDRRYYDGLRELVEELLPQHAVVAEVGSFAGESADIFWKTGRIFFMVCVDPFSNELANDIVEHADHRGTDMNEVKAKFQERTRSYASRVWNPPGMTSLQVADLMTKMGKQFDLVYIDGRHEYEHVRADIMAWAPLVKVGGWLAGHDWQHTDVQVAVQECVGMPSNFYDDNSWALKRVV